MKVIIAAPNSGVLNIGKQGENLARRVQFELPKDWNMSAQDSSVQLAVQRAGEDTAYPVVLAQLDGVWCWDVTSTDTACPGNGQVELRYLLGETIKKSMTWATHTSKSITDNLTDPPEAAEGYLARVMAEGAKVTQAAGRIEQAEQQARDALEQIAPAAEQAVGEIKSEGDTQVQRVATKGAQQIAAAKEQADLAAEAAGNAAGSEQRAGEQADRAEAAAIRQPYPDANTGTWWCWDADAGAYVDSGLKAVPDALRIASPDVLGGVKPVAQTDDMTIPVGVDADGKLYSGKDPDVDQLRRDFADNAEADAETRRKLDYLWKLNQGISYQFETNDAEAYQKTVPSGAKVASVEAVGGKTLLWNQNTQMLWYGYGGHGKVENNGENVLTYTFILAGNDVFYNSMAYNISVIKGHKYYQSFKFSCYKSCEISFGNVNDNWSFFNYSVPNSFMKNSAISTATSPRAICIGVNSAYNTGFSPGDTFCVKDIIIVDLTSMFGSGNEPTSTDDPRIAWIEQYAADHPEYNAGELVSADVESVKYNDAVVAEIPEAVRNLPGYGWSAGNAYNSIERTETGWQYIQRVGSVDLGTLYWVNNEKIESGFFSSNAYEAAKGLCFTAKYKMKNDSANWGSWDDCSISHNDGYRGGQTGNAIKNVFIIKDLSLVGKSGEEVKSYLQGMICLYELADPVATDITDLISNFPEFFEVEAGGTLTFENSAQLPVPSTEKYLIALAEVNQ